MVRTIHRFKIEFLILFGCFYWLKTIISIFFIMTRCNIKLYVTSGHYEKYGDDSFQPIKTPKENEEFYLKPMNCPHHCEIYNSNKFS